jgi:ABC-type multidrug transport system ATPase subunit
VLDEPTEGLDPVMKERFVGLLAEHRQAGGTTFLWTSPPWKVTVLSTALSSGVTWSR